MEIISLFSRPQNQTTRHEDIFNRTSDVSKINSMLERHRDIMKIDVESTSYPLQGYLVDWRDIKDEHRTKSSSGSAPIGVIGRSSVDNCLTLHYPSICKIHEKLMPVIRMSNYIDPTCEIPSEEFYIDISKNDKTQPFSVAEILENFKGFFPNWNGDVDLSAEKDREIFDCCTQYSTLPNFSTEEESFPTEFVPKVYVYTGKQLVVTIFPGGEADWKIIDASAGRRSIRMDVQGKTIQASINYERKKAIAEMNAMTEEEFCSLPDEKRQKLIEDAVSKDKVIVISIPLKSNTISKASCSFPPTHVTEPQASTELKDRSFWINYIEILGGEELEEVYEVFMEVINSQQQVSEKMLLEAFNEDFGTGGSSTSSTGSLTDIIQSLTVKDQTRGGGGSSSTVRIEAFEEARIALGSELSRVDSRGDSEGVSRDSSLKIRVSITHFTLVTEEYDKLGLSFIEDIRAKIQRGYKDRPETKLESGFTLSRLNNHISVVNHRYKMTQEEVAYKHSDRAITPERTKELIDQIRSELLCPITMDVLKDPVILEDGQTYSKEAIEQYFNSLGPRKKSPMTRQIVSGNTIPNIIVRKLIEQTTM